MYKRQAKHNIKNSIEFTERLINVELNRNTKLYSFDISNTYTNIPIEETINIIINNLKTNNESNTYLSLIHISTFTYYGNITQKLNKIFKDTNLKISYNTENIIFNQIKT